MSKTILILYGGGGEEHEISQLSCNYIKEEMAKLPDLEIMTAEIDAEFKIRNDNKQEIFLNHKGVRTDQNQFIKIDYIIPCIHGRPGETGDIQSLFDLYGISYWGSASEASINCFNKITTKLWLEMAGIPTTPSVSLANMLDKDKAFEFMKEHKSVYVKASNQGSSVGCYYVDKINELEKVITKAFDFSQYVLVEKNLTNKRELEVATFEYQRKVHATAPGEIVCPEGFYDYSEKYSESSATLIKVKAEELSSEQIKTIQAYSIKAFQLLKLKSLARIDFFLCDNGEVFINEINTFPGMTKISLFPQMVESYGVSFKELLADAINVV